MKLRAISRMGKWVMIVAVVVAAGCEKQAQKAGGPKVEPQQTQTAAVPQKAAEPAPKAVEAKPETAVTAQEPKATTPEPEKPVVKPEKPVAEAQKPVVTEPVKATEPVVEPNKPTPKPASKAEPVKIALKYTVGDVTTYKVTTVNDKSVEWEGPAGSKPAAFTGGHTGNQVEVTFQQKITSVDEKGNAVAEITIKDLKYVQKVKDQVVASFAGADANDATSQIGKLIGGKYTIEISPSGQLNKIIDASNARTRVVDKVAQSIVSNEAIKERHSIPALDTGKSDEYSAGQTWSNIRTIDFGMMGAKAYERIYTLKKGEPGKVAEADMSAIPSAAKAEELHAQQAAGIFAKMFDNTDKYTGQLKLDLASGKVLHYGEKLYSEWVAVDPQAAPDKQPDALKMTATRSYVIDKVD